MNENTPHVVILGGGFAGLAAAKSLRRANVSITLVDRQNHHCFQPLLYQVATAGLAAPEIAQPLRHIFSAQRNVVTRMDSVQAIDPVAKAVILDGGRLDYDFLIVALGARTGYFGNNHWEKDAPGLKTLDEAKDLRRRILLAFERAENSSDPKEVAKQLSFVVVGGGPTGVEMAGAMAELSRRALARDFRRIDPTQATIHLVEAGPRLLPMFSEKHSDYTRRRLERMGVTVHLNAPVSAVETERVQAGEQALHAGTIIWAAGVEGNPVARSLGSGCFDRGGRVQVEADLTLPGFPEVFVAGDLANLTDVRGKRVPGVAPAAMQMGRHAARQILATLQGRKRTPFRYFDKGNLATIGRSSAVAEVSRLHLAGPLAWLMWLAVHLLFLLGFRNRTIVFLHWVWSYLTWQRGARIITGLWREEKPARREERTAA